MLHLIRKKEQGKIAYQNSSEAYDRAIEKVYKRSKITLAIARMGYFEGHGKSKDGSNLKNYSPDFMMSGVVHENGQFDRRIQCDIEFIDSSLDEASIGWCCLAYLIEGDDDKKKPEQRTLSLTGKIYDPENELRQRVYSTLRDSAISGNRFCHFEIVTDEQDASEAIQKIRSGESGPSKKILGFKMWPEIILPNAPAWGSKHPYE